MFVAGAVAASAQSAFPQHKYTVVGANITAGANMAAVGDADGQAVFEIAKRDIVPFTQQCVNQGKPAPVTNAGNTPYYNVRMALPVPSCYTPTEQGEKVGLDWGVYTHLHSAGMEVLPNGDILAVYFSTPTGKAEADTCTTLSSAAVAMAVTNGICRNCSSPLMEAMTSRLCCSLTRTRFGSSAVAEE